MFNMRKTIPHSRPSMGQAEKRACAQVIDSLYLAGGPRVEAFETAFAKRVGRRYAIAVSSGTAALAMALKALNLQSGRMVAIPSYTCTALLHSLDFAGLSPLITDIDADDMNMSAVDLKKRLKKNTGAVIVPHLFGRAADMKAFEKLGVPIIEDGTQALGALVYGKPVGSFGEMSVFSFYATKMITTGEGGMIVTNSSKLAGALCDMRDYDKKQDYRFRMNFKMSDLQAAIGLCQLQKLPKFVKERKRIARIYNQELLSSVILSKASIRKANRSPDSRLRENDKVFILPQASSDRDSVYFRYVLRVPGGAGRLIRHLNKQGIEAKSPIFKPLHRYLGLPDSNYPETVVAMSETCSLPIFPALTTADVNCVNQTVLSFLG